MRENSTGNRKGRQRLFFGQEVDFDEDNDKELYEAEYSSKLESLRTLWCGVYEENQMYLKRKEEMEADKAALLQQLEKMNSKLEEKERRVASNIHNQAQRILNKHEVTTIFLLVSTIVCRRCFLNNAISYISTF